MASKSPYTPIPVCSPKQVTWSRIHTLNSVTPSPPGLVLPYVPEDPKATLHTHTHTRCVNTTWASLETPVLGRMFWKQEMAQQVELVLRKCNPWHSCPEKWQRPPAVHPAALDRTKQGKASIYPQSKAAVHGQSTSPPPAVTCLLAPSQRHSCCPAPLQHMTEQQRPLTRTQTENSSAETSVLIKITLSPTV